MPSPSPKILVYNQTWELWENRTALTNLLLVGNRLKQTSANYRVRELIARTPSDFPQINLKVKGYVNSAFVQPERRFETLDMEDVNFLTNGGSWSLRRTLDLEATITSDLLRIDQADPVEEEAQLALLKAGPKYGLSFVTRWGPLMAKQEETDQNTAKGVRRIVTTLSWTVSMLFDGQTAAAAG